LAASSRWLWQEACTFFAEARGRAVRPNRGPGSGDRRRRSAFARRIRLLPCLACSAEQIAASIDVLGGSATIAVRHVRGRACHLVRLPVHLKMWDRAGNPVHLPTAEGAHLPFWVAGDFSSGFERLLSIHRVFPECDQRGPFLVVGVPRRFSCPHKASRPQRAGCARCKTDGSDVTPGAVGACRQWTGGLAGVSLLHLRQVSGLLCLAGRGCDLQ
jgi:hypothetical protein